MMCNLSNEGLTCAVDLEVIRGRTHNPSETMGTRDDFCQNLMGHDLYCVWMGISELYSSGMHIIPHRWGSEVCSTIYYLYII
jgi:hypothetical protein